MKRPAIFFTITTKATIHNIFLLLIPIALVLSINLVACEGPTGSEGPQGEMGPIGPAGEDGSMIHAGEGPPTEESGKLGDFYLNTNNAELYGPKTEEGWGVPISLKGSQGEDGSQIYAGTSPPDGSLGQPGDYYLNKSTFDLYGPKTEEGWSTPINLQATTNVMYSVWMDIIWTNTGQFLNSMQIPESRITKDFLNSGGTVLMYIKVETMGVFGVLSLPHLDKNDLLRYSALIVPSPNDFQGIVLYQDSVDDMTPLSIDYTTPENQIRYVLIPGSEQISAKAPGQPSPVDLDDYEQVKKYFGISDNRSGQLQ